MDRNAAVGVFDSGLGGLTVVRAIQELLPSERVVYLGDTARVPYGTRSAHTVIRYARRCAHYLAQHELKLLVVACNTVSAVALPMLRAELDLPVLGVVRPGARAGVLATRNHRIGVLATAGTVRSNAYPQAVAAASTRVEVYQRAAPLLVPLVEEGLVEGRIPELVVNRYLEELLARGVDTLILGCTHYPLLIPTIGNALRAQTHQAVSVVDGARATAEALAAQLQDRDLLRDQAPSELRLRVTDLPERFAAMAAAFLGSNQTLDLEAVDI